MQQRLVIVGAGFAGMYATLSAARLRDIVGISPREFEIALIAPEPTLVVRPRLSVSGRGSYIERSKHFKQ
jgi:NADH dehydrogenase